MHREVLVTNNQLMGDFLESQTCIRALNDHNLRSVVLNFVRGLISMLVSKIDTVEDALEQIGGKGRSLSKMVRSGFTVPGGFIVTADAYRKFIRENGLQNEILKNAKPTLKDGYPVFDDCSNLIREQIIQVPLGEGLIKEIEDAYNQLVGDDTPVAVRSSANAEDLPGLSFAGQQETFLNVRGSKSLVEAVQKCWASLWTAQALSYRHQNGIDQNSVAMAVVVQKMVPSEVSGILFTANPATGDRSEMIINSSFGLGEAVVSGQVTPDTYIVNRQDLKLKDTVLGPKEQQVVYDGDQGIRIDEVSSEDRDLSSLSDCFTFSGNSGCYGLFGGIAGFIGFRFITKRNAAIRFRWHRQVLRLPVFGDMILKSMLARISLIMGNLSAAGVNLLESLEIAKSVSNNDVITDALENVKKGVFSGDTLTKLFLKEPLFPPTFSQLISVGEQTGQLDEMFNSVATYYEEEFDTTVDNMSSLIEPIMIVFMGVMIGGLMLSLIHI